MEFFDNEYPAFTSTGLPSNLERSTGLSKSLNMFCCVHTSILFRISKYEQDWLQLSYSTHMYKEFLLHTAIEDGRTINSDASDTSESLFRRKQIIITLYCRPLCLPHAKVIRKLWVIVSDKCCKQKLFHFPPKEWYKKY